MNNNFIDLLQSTVIVVTSWATHILAVKIDNEPLQTLSLTLSCIVSLIGIYNFIATRLERRRGRKKQEP